MPNSKSPYYYKYRTLASFLPKWVLNILIKRWKLAYDPSDGWTFWLDAEYSKYVRKEKRRWKREAPTRPYF